MDVIATIGATLLNLITSLLSGLFSVLFFWLPDDPFIGVIESVDLSFTGNAVGWLNWFFDVGYFAGLFVPLISALLIWAAWKIAVSIYGLVQKLIEMIPFIE